MMGKGTDHMAIAEKPRGDQRTEVRERNKIVLEGGQRFLEFASGYRVRIADIRREADRQEVADHYASGDVVVWNRATPGLTGDAFSEQVAHTIQKIKGQEGEPLRGNVISLSWFDVSNVVDVDRHASGIRTMLKRFPSSLVAGDGGVFWNVFPRPELAQAFPWLTKPQLTGKPTFVINVHDDPFMGNVFGKVRDLKRGTDPEERSQQKKGKKGVFNPSHEFAIQGTSANYHGAAQPKSLEELDEHIFAENGKPREGVAQVIFDASYVGFEDEEVFASTPSQFSIVDLTGKHVGQPGQEFSFMREGAYPMPKSMERLVGMHRRLHHAREGLKGLVESNLPHRRTKAE